jgi:hypothetical protein
MRLLVLLSTALILGACSATNPKVQTVDQSQYCYTDQKIVKKNNTEVSSETVVTCSDKPNLNNMKIVKSGIADSCREYYYYVGKEYKRGFICKKLDKNGGHGGWEIVNRKHFN